MEGEVLEGFLCPICFADLKTAINLNSHFEEQHSDDQKLFKSVKDIYEKAKRKIRGSEQPFTFSTSDADTGPIVRRTIGYRPSSPCSFDSVSSRSLTDRFKAIRDLRNERYAAQTNTLLIRLEKLLRNLPTDPIRRKAYEQEIVPWLDDKSVSLCPGCAKSFSLLKRKHHCRLCGAVMCRNCTFSLQLDSARKMVGTISEASEPKKVEHGSPAHLSRLQPVQAVLALDVGGDSAFPLCEHCNRLLYARETSRHNRSERPIVAQFYDRLRSALDSCDKAVLEYHLVFSSICAGETKYSLTSAKELRVDLLRLAETVDLISKNISILGQNSDNPPTGVRLQLQQTVRNAAALYLKQKVISLPSLPTEAEVAEFQERKRLEIEKKIEAERKELEDDTKYFPEAKPEFTSTNRPAVPKSNKVTMEAGWTPTVKQAIISDDPILQQIGILHGFIEQAERAGKIDECAALRRNLLELEEMLDEREAIERSVTSN